jgi:hypothetical protein
MDTVRMALTFTTEDGSDIDPIDLESHPVFIATDFEKRRYEIRETNPGKSWSAALLTDSGARHRGNIHKIGNGFAADTSGASVQDELAFALQSVCKKD